MSDEEFAATEGRSSTLRAPRFNWTSAIEASFFRSLCEAVQLGLRENHSFKAEAWDRAGKILREQYGVYPTKAHLVNKSDNARKKFRLWRGLRESPEFLYNPATRTVTGTDEAWKAHIQKEPLARGLRGRTFEHEEYMEILYPDVVGSGGAPKRILKPRRKGPDAFPGVEEAEMPGTAVLDLQGDQSFRPPPPSVDHRQSLAPTTTTRPTSTTIPPRTTITNISALTPPEETALQSRKRLMPPPATSNATAAAPNSSTASALKRRRTSGGPAGTTGTIGDRTTNSGATTGRNLLEDGLAGLAEMLKARAPPRWPEQAMEIFFRDFADEDMDLQFKIAEKALTDENKAMVFCKMPNALREHWVKKLREVHNRTA